MCWPSHRQRNIRLSHFSYLLICFVCAAKLVEECGVLYAVQLYVMYMYVQCPKSMQVSCELMTACFQKRKLLWQKSIPTWDSKLSIIFKLHISRDSLKYAGHVVPVWLGCLASPPMVILSEQMSGRLSMVEGWGLHPVGLTCLLVHLGAHIVTSVPWAQLVWIQCKLNYSNFDFMRTSIIQTLHFNLCINVYVNK